MIFFWIYKLWIKFKWLFKKPKDIDIAFIDPNRACPVCGAREGRLRAIRVNVAQIKGQNDIKLKCQHTCGVCGCRTFEDPIVKVDVNTVLPSVARDELEMRESMNS